MEKQIVVIVDDHKLFSDGVEIILSQLDFIKKIYKVSNGKEYINLLNTITPDIALMDINMPIMNGIEATINSKKIANTKVIALSMHDNIDYYNKMIEAGVDGFVTKNTDSDELALAIKKVINNGHYFSPKILENVIKDLNTSNKAIQDQILFSKRELDVLKKMAKGLTNQEIAEALYVSSRTVDRHKENMYLKTNCKNGIGLIIFAIKNKYINI